MSSTRNMTFRFRDSCCSERNISQENADCEATKKILCGVILCAAGVSAATLSSGWCAYLGALSICLGADSCNDGYQIQRAGRAAALNMFDQMPVIVVAPEPQSMDADQRTPFAQLTQQPFHI